MTASAESGDAMASDKPLSSPAPTGTSSRLASHFGFRDVRLVGSLYYDRNLGGNVGGIRKQTQAPSHYNNEHLASDVCRQVRVVVRVNVRRCSQHSRVYGNVYAATRGLVCETKSYHMVYN